MSVNVQLEGGLQRISNESISTSKVTSALGYTPAKADDLQEHLQDVNSHITEDERVAWRCRPGCRTQRTRG